MEKETFDCEEFQPSKENEPFPAERYSVSEVKNVSSEHFDVPETGSTSQGGPQKESAKMSLDEAKDLAQGASASSSSGAAAASAASSATSAATAGVSITGVVTGAAVVFVAVSTGVVPIEGLTEEESIQSSESIVLSSSESIESSSEPIIESSSEESSSPEESSTIPEPIDVGTLAFSYFKVDYRPSDDGSGILTDIAFHFDGSIAEGISATLSDAVTGASAAIEKGEVLFTDVERGEREFTLAFYKDDEEIETRSIHVEDQYLYDPSLGADFAYRATFNDDGTTNLYASLTPGIEGNFEASIRLMDDTWTSLSYVSINEGPLARVMNVTESNYVAAFDSYFVKDGNYYSFYSQEGIPVETDAFDFSADVQDKTLTLSFFHEIVGEVSVTVTHDDLSTETFAFPASDILGGTKVLELSSLSLHPTIEVTAEAIFHNGDPSGKITDYVGTLAKRSTKSKTVDASITSFVTLDRIEIFNSTYNAAYDNQVNAPVFLYLNGFLNAGDTFSVEVYDVDGAFVTSTDALGNFEDPIRFLNLEVEATYTFCILLNGTETSRFEKQLMIPAYENLPSYYCSATNPGDVYVTYNDDGTSNAYIPMMIQETSLDMYYKVYLIDTSVDGESVFYEYVGTDPVAAFENIPEGVYSLKYASMLRDGDTAYSVFDAGWPSGTLYLGIGEKGYYPDPNSVYASYDSGTQSLSITLYGKAVVGDVRLTITPETGDPFEIIVPNASFAREYGTPSAEVDLSSYGLGTFNLAIDGEGIFQYGLGDTVKAATAVKGKESCPFHYEMNIQEASA